MTAVERSKIGTVDKISMVTPQGQVLHQYAPVFLHGTFEEEFIINTEEFRIPSESFYLRLDGKDNRGNEFQRLKPVLISPSSTYVEITPSSSSIEVPPGNSTEADFNICNYGLTTKISVEVSDDLGFLNSPSITTYVPLKFGIFLYQILMFVLKGDCQQRCMCGSHFSFCSTKGCFCRFN